jgi:hypothetical protein
MPPILSPTPSTDGERAARELRRFHELGRSILDRAESDGLSVLAAARIVATASVSLDRARKAARFAKLFEEDDLARSTSGAGPIR